MTNQTRITLKSMRFHALVGILPHERTTAQPIEIDLMVAVGPGDSVVDYRRLHEAAAGVVSAGHIEFLETIAERVAEAAFDTSPRVELAEVAVRKPHVALGAPLDFAEVRIDRVRPSR